MESTVHVYWLPKEGYSPEEYEDAFSCAEAQGQLAIADGATESSFADLWAQSLVNKFTSTPPTITSAATGGLLESWLTPLQKEWHSSIAWDRLPWYAEEKARKGAFATLLGLRFETESATNSSTFFQRMFSLFSKPRQEGPRWHALAVGDSNLFHIRKDALLRSFPLEKAAEFDSRPLLLGSNPKLNANVWANVKVAEGDYQPGDLFILATDALAKWFLVRHEAGSKPWKKLLEMKSEQDFAEFIGKLRRESAIRNDDTTAIIFSWSNSAAT